MDHYTLRQKGGKWRLSPLGSEKHLVSAFSKKRLLEPVNHLLAGQDATVDVYDKYGRLAMIMVYSSSEPPQWLEWPIRRTSADVRNKAVNS